jgi:hypothetical protein
MSTQPQTIESAQLDAIRNRESLATPGPWNWNVNLQSKQMCLESQGRGGWFERIMDFARWGMNSAKARFLDTAKHLMIPADKLAVPIPSREHHADWFQVIDHPDANFIAHSREDIPFLLNMVDQLTQEKNDLLDTVVSCLQAAGGSSDIDELEKQCNAAGSKPSDFIRSQIDALVLQKFRELHADTIGVAIARHSRDCSSVFMSSPEFILWQQESFVQGNGRDDREVNNGS